MLSNDALEQQITEICCKLNEIQIVINGLVSRTQLNQLMYIRQQDITTLQEQVAALQSEVAVLQNNLNP